MQHFEPYLTKLAERPFRPAGLPRPQDVSTGLQLRPGSLDVEIGCGVGLHPIQYARSNPDRQLIAIEHTKEKFEKFKRRFEHHPDLANLLPVHANAISWLSHMLPANTVSRYFILYPNPYPKSRHRNKRWYAMPFMGYLLTTLVSGGTLNLATNLQFYAEEASLFLTQVWGLQLEKWECLQVDSEHTQPFRTHFEKKYLLRGEKCHDLLFRKP